MQIFVLALSRLVPISFLVSLTLIGSRYAHDLVLRTRPQLARWAFAAVSLVGLIAIAPNVLRAGLIVGAQWAADTAWAAGGPRTGAAGAPPTSSSATTTPGTAAAAKRCSAAGPTRA